MSLGHISAQKLKPVAPCTSSHLNMPLQRQRFWNVYLQKLSWEELGVWIVLCLSQCLWQENRRANSLPWSKTWNTFTSLFLRSQAITLNCFLPHLDSSNLFCIWSTRLPPPATHLHAPVETRHTSCKIMQHELKAVKKKSPIECHLG